MKILIGFARIVVGLLFILSGLIKLNDPVGFSFKLQDYFAPEVLNLEFLMPYALILAIFLVIIEVVLGVSLLLGYLRSFTLWMLLLMIVFFTFLTFYSAYFNKVTDCGCFGDAIPLTPWQSFWKDVILLVLILILFAGKKYIRPLMTTNIRSLVVMLTFVVCLGIGYYVLQHLPIIDFRPYKIGANIAEGMRIPDDAPKPLYEYRWRFKVNGEEKVIVTNGDYPNVDGEFIDVETKLIREGYTPPIHDFTIERDGEDLTDEFLNKPNLIVVVAYSLFNTEKAGYKNIKEATDRAIAAGYEVIGLSASSQELTDELVMQKNLNFDFYFCDETTLKTIIRSNPGIMELQKGTVIQKYHWNDAKKLKLNPQPAEKQTITSNLLKKELDSIQLWNIKLDQLLLAPGLEERTELGKEFGLSPEEATSDLSEMRAQVDQWDLQYIEAIFEKNGYPGKSMVGEPTNLVAYEILKRNPQAIEKHINLIQKAAESGEIPKTKAATLEDLLLMNQNKPQLYGTQGYIKNNGERLIWPIVNEEEVNERRKNAGFTTTIEEYSKELFGPEYEYHPHSLEELNL